ncbi:MAG: M81 family metallopeptidase [Pseudomonadota bacterium]
MISLRFIFLTVVFGAAGLVFLLFKGGEAAASEPVKVAYAFFMHETCTFCPSPPTGIKEFEYLFPPLTGESLKQIAENEISYIGGFYHRMNDFPEVDIVDGYLVGPSFGGSSGSWVSREAFDKYTSGMIEVFTSIPGLDGVYLALHGGMAVEGIDRPEAEIVRRVRKAVGDIPIVATFDHHGNEDVEILEHLDILLAVKRFPHYDANLMGERAAHLLVRTMRGDYKPTMAAAKPGVFFATVFGGTHQGAPQDIMERARRWENRERDVYVSVFQGWTFADVPDIGMAVMAVTNDDQALADEIVEDMRAYIWSRREDFEWTFPGVEEGVAQGLQALSQGRGRVVLANLSDRMGDSTRVTHELLEAGISNMVVGSIADIGEVGRLAKGFKVGDTVSVSLGGKSSDLAGAPLEVSGILRFAGIDRPQPNLPGARYALLELPKNNWVLISEYYHQVTSPKTLERFGVPVNDLDLFVVKSRNHFRSGFMETGFAKTAITIDAPGHGPADISRLEYKSIPDGMYSKFRVAE